MTVKIKRTDGTDPRPVVEAFVAGQSYPFIALLTHKNATALVVPSSGVNDPIEPGQETRVKVRNFDQAWMLVSDLSELAHRAGNDAEDYAVLVAPEVAPEPEQPAEPGANKEPEAGKAGKAKAAAPLEGK